MGDGRLKLGSGEWGAGVGCVRHDIQGTLTVSSRLPSGVELTGGRGGGWEMGGGESMIGMGDRGTIAKGTLRVSP